MLVQYSENIGGKQEKKPKGINHSVVQNENKSNFHMAVTGERKKTDN